MEDDQSALSLQEETDLRSFVQIEASFYSNQNSTKNIVEDVEIIPAEMVFYGAYEGKEFTKVLTLKNVGSKPATVRIGSPTAKCFKMHPMKHTRRLPPGLAISRKIYMKYIHHFVVHDAQIPILINRQTVIYHLNMIMVEPTEINFGQIDVQSGVAARSVQVKNDGSKSAPFCIDLGRNELELIVEPTRGVVQASESVELHIEVMGFNEGPFKKEFWIKTMPPQRVTVIGEFIRPRIVATHPRAYTDFSMIFFPRLYIGQSFSRTLIVKNISSSDAMFCIKGILNGKTEMIYHEAKSVDEHFKDFNLSPLEGRLSSQENAVVEITFEPVNSTENHTICFVQVIRVDWTDVDDSVVIRANATGNLDHRVSSDRSRGSFGHESSPISNIHDDTESKDSNSSLSLELLPDDKVLECETFRVCLYGEKEKANVKFRPSLISLNDIQINNSYFREIWFENSSSYLPITVNYVKVAFIDVEPSKIFLKPKESKELMLRINTKQPGFHSLNANFELLIYERNDYTNQITKKVVLDSVQIKVSFTGILKEKTVEPKFVSAITPKITNEVGFLTENIRFNDKFEKLKCTVVYDFKKVFRDSDSDLIAFPNDRPKCLRPWTGPKKCKTIFAKIPRAVASHDEYGFATSELFFRQENRDYYVQYLRKNWKKKTVKRSEKNMAITKKWMDKFFVCEMEESVKKDEVFLGFVPLDPIFLHNVKIVPRYIRLQRVAPISNVETTFAITNKNTFPILVYMTSVKPGIYFPQGHCKIVAAEEHKTITLACFAGLVGRYINLIQIIVNYSHLFSIGVMVEVVPKMINLTQNVLNFEPENSGNVKFIRLKNHLNSSISFEFEKSMSRFFIEPAKGIILQKRSILCAIHYKNVPEMSDYCELALRSEGGGSQILQLSRKKTKPKVEFHPKQLQFENLPFNIETNCYLRAVNKSNYDICYLVANACPMAGIEISPTYGVIPGNGDAEFYVTITVKDTENFSTKFEFFFEDQFKLSIPVVGHIVLPNIELRPESIVNRQLIPFAYRRNFFYVKNESLCEAMIRFDLDQYEYFRVTEDENDLDLTLHNTNLRLAPGEVKTLHLHFQPLDALTESFYMPIVINDIIGPPLMSNEESFEVQLGETIAKLPRLRITSICNKISLSFSTLKLTFVHAASDLKDQQRIKFFTAKNYGTVPVEYCFKFGTNFGNDFVLEYHSGSAVNMTRVSLIGVLNPNDSTVFSVKFNADKPGEYKRTVPIYVKNYLNGCIFNFLRMIGRYEKATITSDKNCYFMGCVPVGFKTSTMIDLHLKHHFEERCVMTCNMPPLDIMVTFREQTRGNKNELKTKILVMCTRPTSIFEDIEFYCSCSASYKIKVIALSDHCFLSHYSYFRSHLYILENLFLVPIKHLEIRKIVMGEFVHNPNRIPSFESIRYVDMADYPENLNLLGFPFFPLNVDKNDKDYHENLRITLDVVEKWICSRCFYMKKFYKIPSTIALPPTAEQIRERPYVEPVIVSLISELGGEQVREESIKSRVVNMEQKNVALHFFTTYTNLMNFMHETGALLPHCLPEMLLTYRFYEIIWEYYPHMMSLKVKFDQENFERYSTRCYMDIILQSIKIFVLNRIKMFNYKEKCETIPANARPLYEMTKQNSNIYTVGEHILLFWLKFHYENEKTKLWKKDLESLNRMKEKDITVFVKELDDSLVFACVTSAYCPYLSHLLTDMYVPPVTFEEYHHNACTLIETWNLLHLSYKVDPINIVKPNGMNMFLLTLYLYENLPNFYPRQTLTLESKLTQSSSSSVSLHNPTGHAILYAVNFFGNDTESFWSEVSQFRLGANRHGSLKITYQAKKISNQKAVLVLSGELPGQKYGKCVAVNLNGITDLKYLTRKVVFRCELYKIYRMKIKLFNPYNVPDNYEVVYALTDKKNENEELELYSWKEYVLGKIPKRMYTKKYNFVVTNPEDGFLFEPIICCQMLPLRIYKMFMVGKHGDWCFEIRIVPKISKNEHEVVNVSLPRGFANQVCSCRENSSEMQLVCPRTIKINIPSKNNLFYKSIRDMFIACTDEQFLSFWRKYLPMRAVLNILNVLYCAQEQFSRIIDEYKFAFSKNRKFYIYTEEDSMFVAQKTVVIEDSSSDKSIEILIHAKPEFDSNVSNFLIMESESKYAKRFYKINFYES